MGPVGYRSGSRRLRRWKRPLPSSGNSGDGNSRNGSAGNCESSGSSNGREEEGAAPERIASSRRIGDFCTMQMDRPSASPADVSAALVSSTHTDANMRNVKRQERRRDAANVSTCADAVEESHSVNGEQIQYRMRQLCSEI